MTFTKTFFTALRIRWWLAGILFLAIAKIGAAQDTLYFDQNYDRVSDRAAARFMEVRVYNPADSNKCIVMTYQANGNVISVDKYSNYAEGERNGRCSFWFSTAQLCSEIQFAHGKRQGAEKNFYQNGQLQSQIMWDQDTIVSGVFFNEDGSPKTQVFQEDLYGTEIQQTPSFPGGDAELTKYLWATLHYPEKARDHNEQGRVLMSFVVEKNGAISQVKVLESVTPALDAEAIRVVKTMPRWKPGNINGLPIRVRFSFPVRFRLE